MRQRGHHERDARGEAVHLENDREQRARNEGAAHGQRDGGTINDTFTPVVLSYYTVASRDYCPPASCEMLSLLCLTSWYLFSYANTGVSVQF